VWNGNPRTQANVAIRVVAHEAVSNRILVSYGVVLGRAGAVRVQPQAWEEAMKSLALKVQRFLVSEDGPTAVEYAVMLALIIIVCLTAISAVGSSARAQFQNIATQIDGAN
jgi:pilus assembly protein Flp/PilA